MLSKDQFLIKMYKTICKYGSPPTQEFKVQRYTFIKKCIIAGDLLYEYNTYALQSSSVPDTQFDLSFKSVAIGRGKPKPKFGQNDRKKQVDRVLLACREKSNIIPLSDV